MLLWTGLLVLAAFGIVFTFANYPWFGVVLVSLLLIAHSERIRRRNQRASEGARRRDRARQRDLPDPWDPPEGPRSASATSQASGED